MGDINGLAPREREVLSKLAEGLSSKQVAADLDLTVDTVRWYTKRIHKALGVTNRAAAVRIALENDLGGQDMGGRSKYAPLPLPPAIRPMVGREEVLERLDSVVVPGRIVTICGIGGAGKSTIALEWARRKGERFADGLVAAYLESAVSDEEVATAILHAAGAAPPPAGVEPWDEIAEMFADKSACLLIDNAEQFVAATNWLAGLLERCPGLCIVATSRQPFDLQREAVLRLDGLASPPDRLTDPAPYEAVGLFVAEAHRRDLSRDFSTRELGEIGEICALVGGNPLAIILAAAWTDTLRPGEILAEVSDDLSVLRAPGDHETRHDSIAQVIEATLQKLPPDLLGKFVQLPVFSDGFARQAAKEVTGCDLNDLAGLASRSLVQLDPGSARYRLHPLVRSVTQQSMSAAGTGNAVHDRHARYYCRMLADLRADVFGQDQPAAIEALDAERENIFKAWRLAATSGASGLIMDAVDTLAAWMDLRTDLGRACRLLDEAMTSGPGSDYFHLVAIFRDWIGMQHGDLPGDGLRTPDSLVQFRRQTNRRDLVGAVEVVAAFLQTAVGGDPKGGFAAAQSIDPEGLSGYWEARRLFLLALIFSGMGDHGQALTTSRNMISVARQAGDLSGAHLGVAIAQVFALRGDQLGQLPGLFRLASVLHDEVEDTQTSITVLTVRGLLYCWSGTWEQAAEVIEEGHRIGFEENAIIRKMFLSASTLHHGLTGNRTAAERTMDEAAVAEDPGMWPEYAAWMHWGLALACCSEADFAGAQTHLEQMKVLEAAAAPKVPEAPAMEAMLEALVADGQKDVPSSEVAVSKVLATPSNAHDMYRRWLGLDD